jgi:F-type H+-transporting ATPase subunit delta
MSELLGTAYGEALFSLAEAEEKVHDYQLALEDVSALFAQEPTLAPTLASYAIPLKKLYSLVDEIWGKSELSHLPAFMKLLVEKRMILHFERVKQSYDKLANEAQGVKVGVAYSAFPLSKEEIAKLEQALGAKLGGKVKLTSRVDASLLGGVKVVFEGHLYDGSLAGRLEALRSRLLDEKGAR